MGKRKTVKLAALYATGLQSGHISPSNAWPGTRLHTLENHHRQAVADVSVKHIVADTGYDSEQNHHWTRIKRKIRTTISEKVSRAPKGLPKTPYRRAMKRHFDNSSYRQRWQVETVFSMIKRLLGYILYARHAQCRKIVLLALTYNLMIILFCQFAKELFYRAKSCIVSKLDLSVSFM